MTALRIPFYLFDASAAPVTGLSLSGSDLQISKAGGAFANGTGGGHEIGAGAYYYEVGTGEDTTDGDLLLKVVKATTLGADLVERIPVRGDLVQSDATAATRRISFNLRDSAGARVTGQTFSGAEIQISKNGAAFANAAGAASVVELGGGDYYYPTSAAELDTIGFVLLKVNKAGSRIVVYSARVGSPPLRIENITPIDGEVTPGTAGAFSASFRVARLTPIEFDLIGLTIGEQISISVSYANRTEIYMARDLDGSRSWPFDVVGDNAIGDLTSEPVHVTMLPRGGWPPCRVNIKVASARMAAET